MKGFEMSEEQNVGDASNDFCCFYCKTPFVEAEDRSGLYICPNCGHSARLPRGIDAPEGDLGEVLDAAVGRKEPQAVIDALGYLEDEKLIPFYMGCVFAIDGDADSAGNSWSIFIGMNDDDAVLDRVPEMEDCLVHGVLSESPGGWLSMFGIFNSFVSELQARLDFNIADDVLDILARSVPDSLADVLSIVGACTDIESVANGADPDLRSMRERCGVLEDAYSDLFRLLNAFRSDNMEGYMGVSRSIDALIDMKKVEGRILDKAISRLSDEQLDAVCGRWAGSDQKALKESYAAFLTAYMTSRASGTMNDVKDAEAIFERHVDFMSGLSG